MGWMRRPFGIGPCSEMEKSGAGRELSASAAAPFPFPALPQNSPSSASYEGANNSEPSAATKLVRLHPKDESGPLVNQYLGGLLRIIPHYYPSSFSLVMIPSIRYTLGMGRLQ